jgi:diaminohydroxyphosphoribosylaminopyrimidine deaminase/5-amino-6-(5-phosphoribosylamino)uracil reductase
LRLPASGKQVEISSILSVLKEQDIVNILLEGGPTVAGAFWKSKLVDRLVAFLAPKVLADPEARPMIFGDSVEAMSQATSLRGVEVRRLGDDLMVTGRIERSEAG